MSLVLQQLDAGVDAGAADKDDQFAAQCFADRHRPSGAALGMARGQVSLHGDVPQRHGIAIVQHAIHGCRLPAVTPECGAVDSRGDRLGILADRHHFGSGQLLHPLMTFDMVPMGMAGDHDLHITGIKAQLLDPVHNDVVHRRGAAIEQNQSVGSLDDVGRNADGADVIDVVDHAERFDRFAPLSAQQIRDRALTGGNASIGDGQQKQQWGNPVTQRTNSPACGLAVKSAVGCAIRTSQRFVRNRHSTNRNRGQGPQ